MDKPPAVPIVFRHCRLSKYPAMIACSCFSANKLPPGSFEFSTEGHFYVLYTPWSTPWLPPMGSRRRRHHDPGKCRRAHLHVHYSRVIYVDNTQVQSSILNFLKKEEYKKTARQWYRRFYLQPSIIRIFQGRI